MNWEAISAISQMIGSIAVVFSVLYLAIQVHRSTRIAKMAAQDAAATALREVTKPFAENAELARIWRVGLENLESLSAEDQARFFHSTYQFLKAFETIHFHHVNGLMDNQIWQGWCGLLEHYVASPGIDHYWRLRRNLFSKRFQNFVDVLDRPAERRTVANLLGQEKR
ncbi:MAG: hypothetical protein JWO45_1565 [Spartobacteria bacterium]|nr:hypothetical protein [Spartobacteria bacterium]